MSDSIPWSHNHPVPKNKIGAEVTRAEILSDYANSLFINPSQYYGSWPPPAQRTKDEVEKMTFDSNLSKWINTLMDSDKIHKFSNFGTLCGSSGYVALRDSAQVSVFDMKRS